MLKILLEKKRMLTGLFVVLIMALACYQMAFVITPGLLNSENSLQERQAFIVNHLSDWQFGWICWIVAALSLLTFFSLLLKFIPESSTKTLGFLLIGLGTLPDITAEIIFGWVIPESIRIDPTLVSMQTLEILAFYLTGFLGNGFYSLGGLILTIGLLKNKHIDRSLIIAGLPAWIFGFGLSYACITQSFFLAAICTGLAMVWSSIWFFIVSLTLFRHEHVYEIS
ncbi:MAG: hypothetical protein IPK77_08915 [Cellvibrio sp.]|nr:hypothetical protein [Cellvibrio sp.]